MKQSNPVDIRQARRSITSNEGFSTQQEACFSDMSSQHKNDIPYEDENSQLFHTCVCQQEFYSFFSCQEDSIHVRTQTPSSFLKQETHKKFDMVPLIPIDEPQNFHNENSRHKMKNRSLQTSQRLTYSELSKVYMESVRQIESMKTEMQRLRELNNKLTVKIIRNKYTQTDTYDKYFDSFCNGCQKFRENFDQLEIQIVTLTSDLRERDKEKQALMAQLTKVSEQLDQYKNRELGVSLQLSDCRVYSPESELQANIMMEDPQISSIKRVNKYKQNCHTLNVAQVRKGINFQQQVQQQLPHNQRSPSVFDYQNCSFLAEKADVSSQMSMMLENLKHEVNLLKSILWNAPKQDICFQTPPQ